MGQIIGAVAGGLIQGRSASRAAQAQQAAAQQQLDFNREVWEQTRDDLGGYRDQGGNALAALMFDMGLTDTAPVFGGTAPEIVEFTENWSEPNSGYNALNPYWNSRDGTAQPRDIQHSRTRFRVGDEIFDERDAAQQYADANPIGGTEYGGWQTSPGYEFRLDQGLDALEGRAAAGGNLLSGSTLAARERYAQDYGSNEYGMQMNRLAQLAGMGQSAAGMTANANQNFANMGSQAFGQMGNAASAGHIAQGNAWVGALDNLSGGFGYMKGQGGNNANLLSAPWGSSGFWG